MLEIDSDLIYKHEDTSWCFHFPNNVHQVVAKFLGLNWIWCIGVNKTYDVILVQHSRDFNPKTKIIPYVVVLPIHNDAVQSLIAASYTMANHLVEAHA